MPQQFVVKGVLAKRLAALSLILTAIVAIAISLLPGTVFAVESDSTAEPSGVIEPAGTDETSTPDGAGSDENDLAGEATYTITVSADSSEGGTVSGGGDYAEGESVTVTATANEQYTFVSWSENGEPVSTEASYTFTAAEDRTLLAIFDVQEYEIAEGGGHSTGHAYENVTPLSGDALDGATIRLRPQGSDKQVTIESNGSGALLNVHLFDIGASSRFKLMKASDDSYYISYYKCYEDTEPHTEKYYCFGVADSSEKTLARVRVNSLTDIDASKRWKIYQLEDGTYWISNVNSGLYLALYELENINKNENRLVQRHTRMKWEIEFVRGPMQSNNTRNDLKEYDSYTFEYNNGGDSATVTSADWMSHLSDDVYLTDLSIPGVHDAGTVYVGGIVNALNPSSERNPWRCQQLYFDDMLTNGVRYFDLRLAYDGFTEDMSGQRIVVRHGTLGAGLSMCHDRDGDDLTIEQIMDWSTAFLDKHPNETIILAVKDELGTEESSKQIWTCLRGYWATWRTRGRIYEGYGDPQLKDVRGKIVLVSRIDEYRDDTNPAEDRNYLTDPEDPSSPSWAIYADWRQGENFAPALAASTDAYEFWTQDKYHIPTPDKWEWVEGGILSDEATGAKGLHDNAVSQGKGAWVVNFTSTERVLEKPELYPLDCARVINVMLKQSPKLSTTADTYIGIVCVDFIDEQLAQRIYAINFRGNLNRRQQQEVTFSSPIQVKLYGEEPFRCEASHPTGDGPISYESSDSNVATVDDSGRVTIRGTGQATITATAAATDSFEEASGSYLLTVNPAPIVVSAEVSGTLYYGDPVEPSLAIVRGSLKYDDTIDSLGVNMSTEATAGSDVGNYQISLSFSSINRNYTVSLIPGELTISPRPVTISVADKTSTYSGSEQHGETTYSCANVLPDHTATITYTASKGIDASTAAYDNGKFGSDFKVVNKNGVDVTSNYTLTSATPGKLTIGKRSLTFSGVSKTKNYTGSKIEISELAVEGLVSGHTHNVTFSANGTDVGGPYDGTITGKDDVRVKSGEEDVTANYDITVTNGSLTIQCDPDLELLVTLEDKAFTYDATAHALPNAATTNALTGKTLIEYSKDETNWTEDLASLTATNVDDSCTIHVRASNMNYSNTASNSAALTINPAQATITVADASKVQYDSDPDFTGTVEGLVTAGDLGEVVYSRTNDDEAPGLYEDVITASYTPNPNYDVKVVNGDFTIRALLTARWLDEDGTVLQTTDYVEGDPIPSYDGKEPRKAATKQYTYTFAGWDGTVDGATTTYRPLFDTTVNSYKISLNLAGGTLDGQTGVVVWTRKYGSTITLPKPVQKGYTFLYWEGSHYDAGDEYLVKDDHTFTAKWKKSADNNSGNYGNGSGKGKSTIPATGDSSAPFIMVLSIAALGSLCMLVGSALRRRDA